MNRPAPDHGPRDARLLVVGEAGGREEGRVGRPFVGPTGRKVRELIAACGLDAERDVRYANVIPVEMATLPKTVGAMQAVVRRHWGALDATLLRGEHQAVVAYGRAASWRLAGRTAIVDEHGSVDMVTVGGRSVPCVSSIHPASVMRSKIEAQWELVEAATARACRYAMGTVVDVRRQLPPWARKHTGVHARLLRDIAVSTGAAVAIDTEFSRETLIPFLVGVSIDGENVSSFVPNADVIEGLRELCGDTRVTKVFHHAPADIIALSRIGVEVRPPIVDTLMLYATVFPDLPVGLQHVALHLFDDWKAWKEMPHDDPQYNAIDVVATWRAHARLAARMTRDDLWGVWQREVRHITALCMGMEARGLCVDAVAQRGAVAANTATAERLRGEVEGRVAAMFAKRRAPYIKELGEVEAVLADTPLARLRKDRDTTTEATVLALRKRRDRCKTVIARWERGFKLGNNDHLRWLLYDEDGFKLPTQRDPHTGRPTANAGAIARLLALKRVRETAAIRDTLLGIKEYQHLEKMTSTFLLWDASRGEPSGAVDAHGVAHPGYRPFGTGAGRLAGGGDKGLDDRRVNEFAYNSLNIPESTRTIYVPHGAGFVVDGTQVDVTEVDGGDADAGDELADDVL